MRCCVDVLVVNHSLAPFGDIADRRLLRDYREATHPRLAITYSLLDTIISS
jgi:hypothetical protein